MQDIKIREDKIKEKRKKTSRKTFVQEVGSWRSLVLYRWPSFVSRFPKEKENIVKTTYFEEERDNLIKSWQTIQQDKGFFDQFGILWGNALHPNILHYAQNENCDFVDVCLGSKNCYLSNVVILDCSNVLYSLSAKENSHNVLNSVSVINNSENIYFWNGIIESFNVFYSRYINTSNNIWFSTNLAGCSECIFCDDLENQSYCIKNKQYMKEEYFEEKKEILKNKKLFATYFDETNRTWLNKWSENVSWIFLEKCHNLEQGIYGFQVSDSHNICSFGWKNTNTDIFDAMNGWSVGNSDYYCVYAAGAGSQNLYCSCHINNSSNIYYSYNLTVCSYCLGCIGLKNQSFCIFNKQYSKEERFEKANEIFAQMDREWILWNAFPWWLNPFYFNDTLAYLIDDTFTKEEVTKQWYMRRDEEIKVDIPAWADILEVMDLDKYQRFNFSGEREINPEILKKVIKDNKGNYYRIVPMELEFLQKYGLPLPEIHWLERIKLGFKFK